MLKSRRLQRAKEKNVYDFSKEANKVSFLVCCRNSHSEFRNLCPLLRTNVTSRCIAYSFGTSFGLPFVRSAQFFLFPYAEMLIKRSDILASLVRYICIRKCEITLSGCDMISISLPLGNISRAKHISCTKYISQISAEIYITAERKFRNFTRNE